MTVSPVDVARAHIEAFNDDDWERFARTLTTDAIYDEVGTSRRAEGREAILALFKSKKVTTPDGAGTVSSAFAADGVVVLEVTWTGTMTGAWQEATATGRSRSTRAALILRFTGEEISEAFHYFDSLALLRELGLIAETPPPWESRAGASSGPA
jgi:steroid delta-isomerase-like uncharacterized protein